MSDTPRTDAATRMAFSGEYMVPIEDAQKLERELAEVTEQRDGLRVGIDYASDQLTKVKEQRDKLAEAIANHNGEALHASTTKNADNKLWNTLADMKGLNYE